MRPHLHPVVRVFVIFALAAVRSASAQTSRVGFTAITATDLDATDVVDYVAGDFNNDGHLDLMLTARGASTSNVKLLAGSGTGSFSHAGGFSFADASAITTADFNGDGALDVAVTQDVLSKQNSGYSDFVCGSLVGVAIFFGPTMSAGRCLATVPVELRCRAAISIGTIDRTSQSSAPAGTGSSSTATSSRWR